MTEPFVNIDGHAAIGAEVYVPETGPWWADVDLELNPGLSGAVTLQVGNLTLRGTIGDGGGFGLQQRVRVVAGGGGWSKLIPPQAYLNDAGVRRRTVLEDAARLVGEELGDIVLEQPDKFASFHARSAMGSAYVRQGGAARQSLEDVAQGVPWWVGFDGLTHIRERDTFDVDAGQYQVLEFDPRARLATVAVDDFTKVGIGAVLTEGLEEPITVSSMTIKVTPDSARVFAQGRRPDGGRGELGPLLRSIVAKVMGESLFGRYRFRVIQTSGDRLELQAFRPQLGLPDIIPVSMVPGVAGAHAKVTPGTIVLVEFVEGNRALPVVTGFAGRDGQEHEPVELDFAVSATLRLGGASAAEGVTLGDSHKSWADTHTHQVGTLAAPSGAVTGATGPPVTPAPATSSKVKVEA